MRRDRSMRKAFRLAPLVLLLAGFATAVPARAQVDDGVGGEDDQSSQTAVPNPASIDPALLPAWNVLLGVTEADAGAAFRRAQADLGIKLEIGPLPSRARGAYLSNLKIVVVNQSLVDEDAR